MWTQLTTHFGFSIIIYCISCSVYVPFIVFTCVYAEIQSLLGMVRHGMGSFLVFVGLHGTKEDLDIVSTNFWMYKDNDLDSL